MDFNSELRKLVQDEVSRALTERPCSCHASGQRAGAPPRTAYSVSEVARSIGISARHTYVLVETGELAAIRIGRRVVVPVAALAAYLRAAPRA